MIAARNVHSPEISERLSTVINEDGGGRGGGGGGGGEGRGGHDATVK